MSCRPGVLILRLQVRRVRLAQSTERARIVRKLKRALSMTAAAKESKASCAELGAALELVWLQDAL